MTLREQAALIASALASSPHAADAWPSKDVGETLGTTRAADQLMLRTAISLDATHAFGDGPDQSEFWAAVEAELRSPA